MYHMVLWDASKSMETGSRTVVYSGQESSGEGVVTVDEFRSLSGR